MSLNIDTHYIYHYNIVLLIQQYMSLLIDYIHIHFFTNNLSSGHLKQIIKYIRI